MQIYYENQKLEKDRIIQFLNLEPEADRKQIFNVMDCYEGSLGYEEIIEVYEKMLNLAKGIAVPKAAIYIETANQTISESYECEQVIYSCFTLGKDISDRVAKKFEEGEYLEGMILDAIADDFVFNVFDQVYKAVYGYLKENNLGAVRLSPGEGSMDIKYHGLIREKLKLKESIGVEINESYMLAPIKSTSSIFVVDSSIPCTKKLHECRQCSDFSCKWRRETYENKNSAS